MGSRGNLHRGARCPSQFLARQETWPPSTCALRGALVLVARSSPTLNWLAVCAAGKREKGTLAAPRVPYACFASSAPGFGGIDLPTNPTTKAVTNRAGALQLTTSARLGAAGRQAEAQHTPRRLPEKLCPTTGRAKLKRTPALACVLHVICTLCVSLYKPEGGNSTMENTKGMAS